MRGWGDEERHGGEQARGRHHPDQQPAGGAREPEQAALDDLEEAGQLEVGEHDHHAEQEEDRVQVDGGERSVEVQHAARHHGHRTEERSRGAIEAQAGQALQRDHHVGEEEDDGGGRHAAGSYGKRLPCAAGWGRNGTWNFAQSRGM